MSDSLHFLSDQELFSRTHAITVETRRLTLSLLLHLNEIERRRLHLRRGYASLFAYCTTALGFTPAAAMRRIQCARCIALFPEAHELLAANDINLSTLSQVSKILRPENSAVVLDRIRGKSQREVEAIVAEQEPLAAVPHDRVRTVMIRVPVPTVNASSKEDNVAPLSSLACEKNDYFRSGSENADAPAGPDAPGGALLPRLEKRLTVQFTVHPDFMAKVDRVKALASHRLPASASLEHVFELALDLFIEREDPFAREARRLKRAARVSASRRHVPAQVRTLDTG